MALSILGHFRVWRFFASLVNSVLKFIGFFPASLVQGEQVYRVFELQGRYRRFCPPVPLAHDALELRAFFAYLGIEIVPIDNCAAFFAVYIIGIGIIAPE